MSLEEGLLAYHFVRMRVGDGLAPGAGRPDLGHGGVQLRAMAGERKRVVLRALAIALRRDDTVGERCDDELGVVNFPGPDQPARQWRRRR